MERMLIGEADRAENLVTDRRDGTGSLSYPDARGVHRPGLGRVADLIAQAGVPSRQHVRVEQGSAGFVHAEHRSVW
jgi:hypothetical protein